MGLAAARFRAARLRAGQAMARRQLRCVCTRRFALVAAAEWTWDARAVGPRTRGAASGRTRWPGAGRLPPGAGWESAGREGDPAPAARAAALSSTPRGGSPRKARRCRRPPPSASCPPCWSGRARRPPALAPLHGHSERSTWSTRQTGAATSDRGCRAALPSVGSWRSRGSPRSRCWRARPPHPRPLSPASRGRGGTLFERERRPFHVEHPPDRRSLEARPRSTLRSRAFQRPTWEDVRRAAASRSSRIYQPLAPRSARAVSPQRTVSAGARAGSTRLARVEGHACAERAV
jgi:hypothetical protein